MAWFFGESFDLAAAPADLYMGGTYWESGTTGFSLVTGRFAGSRGAQFSSTVNTLQKSSASNDNIHHLNVAIQQTTALTGTVTGFVIRLMDGATPQCSILFRSDGAIVLTSGDFNTAAIATYTGAVAASNTWYGFEIEVVIHNTAGSIAVRKSGSPTNDFSATGLNTRGGTANAYANRITLGASNGTVTQQIDDFLWRSDASSVPWAGELRCYTRMPASDASVQWAPTGTMAGVTQIQAGGGSTAISNTVIRLQPYTLNYTGSISTVTVVTASGALGNIKAAIWADAAGVPGAVLSTAGPQAVVAAGNNVFTLGTPLSVTAGQRLWVGAMIDTAGGQWSTSGTAPVVGGNAAGSYATFPQPNPIFGVNLNTASAITFGAASGNFALVAEAQQDGAITYVSSSTVGQTDLYNVAPISGTPTGIIGVTTRALAQKSDAGTRNLALRLRSGATDVTGTSTALNTSFGWIYRNDLVDPATGAAWGAVAVNNLLIGETVTA